MVYHMLWLARIHTKPEYPFPAETSSTFPETTRCERWVQSKKSHSQALRFFVST